MNENTRQLPYQIEFGSAVDSRGEIFFSVENQLPFTPTRVFFSTPSAFLAPRGEHGHKVCWQVIFPVSDEIWIALNAVPNEPLIKLTKGEALVIPPGNWCKILFKSVQSTAVVLASHPFDESDFFYEPS